MTTGRVKDWKVDFLPANLPYSRSTISKLNGSSYTWVRCRIPTTCVHWTTVSGRRWGVDRVFMGIPTETVLVCEDGRLRDNIEYCTKYDEKH